MFSLHLTNYKYDPNIVLIVQKSIITIGYLIYICVDIFFPFFIISSCHSFIIRLIIIIIFSFILHLVSKTWLIWSAYNALRELDYIFIDFSLFKHQFLLIFNFYWLSTSVGSYWPKYYSYCMHHEFEGYIVIYYRNIC